MFLVPRAHVNSTSSRQIHELYGVDELGQQPRHRQHMRLGDRDVGDNIDRLTCVEMRIPGIDRGIIEPLYWAAREAQGGSSLTLRAARLLRERVGADDVVMIVTGAGAPPYLPY